MEHFLVRLRRADRAAAIAALKAVVIEAQAIERRRLCTDARAFAAAVALTQDEIARHARAAPRSASAARAVTAHRLAPRLSRARHAIVRELSPAHPAV